jgi:hypothetical protein
MTVIMERAAEANVSIKQLYTNDLFINQLIIVINRQTYMLSKILKNIQINLH